MPLFKARRRGHAEVFPGKDGKFRYRIVGANGEKMTPSEAYVQEQRLPGARDLAAAVAGEAFAAAFSVEEVELTAMQMCTADLPGHKDNWPADTEGTEQRNQLFVRPVQGLVQRAVVERSKLWLPGTGIRIAFVDGDSVVQEKVRNVANRWLEHVNLRFEWVSGSADLRISFADKGSSWSYLGTDALGVAGATMNYGWLEPTTAAEEYDRVVLHEFGHALGMHHEHQSPVAGIPWDVEAVYAFYGEYGWTREDVDFNVLRVLSAGISNFTVYDPTSIMQYPIAEDLTLGSFKVGWNTQLSSTDKTFMAQQYPTGAVPVTPLTLGVPVTGSIGAVGEIDYYTLDVELAATFIIKTQGPTDTVLTVNGPDDSSLLAAWDDDRGRLENARVVKKLWPGSYLVSVAAQGVGDYTLVAKVRQ